MCLFLTALLIVGLAFLVPVLGALYLLIYGITAGVESIQSKKRRKIATREDDELPLN
jgi:hypothetical protein